MGVSQGDGPTNRREDEANELDGESGLEASCLLSQYRSQSPPTIDFAKVREVRDLDVGWLSVEDGDVNAAGVYERQMIAANQPVDPGKLAEILGGENVHYRLNVLENGIRYLNITRDSDGTEVYTEKTYHGLTSSDGSEGNDSPYLAPIHVTGTDLGDGFKLAVTTSGSSDGYGRTSTAAEKEYISGDTKVKAVYQLEPTTSNSPGDLYLKYDATTFKDKTQTAGAADARTEETPLRSVKVELSGAPDHNIGAEITVSICLDDRAAPSQWDQATFRFLQNGTLSEIIGISNSDKPNSEWTDSDLLQAIRKGENKWFTYSRFDPEAKIISEAIFGKDITKSSLMSGASLDSIVKSLVRGEELQIETGIQFK